MRCPGGIACSTLRRGAFSVVTGPEATRVVENQAWHGAGACELGGARSRRRRCCATELIRGACPSASRPARREFSSSYAIDLDPRAEYLMRADRVDFRAGRRRAAAPPPGRRHPLSHRRNALTSPWATPRLRRIMPGGAWFETRAGARAGRRVEGRARPSFIRVAIPPARDPRSHVDHVRESERRRARPAALVHRCTSTSRSRSPEATGTRWGASC